MATVEILLASYNGAEYIDQQIASILAQTNQEWLLTVSDDGSTDDTVQIVDRYQEQYPDKIRRIQSGRKFGKARDHFFWMLRNCDADYIFFCDQDDVWKPEKVEKSVGMLRAAEAELGKDCPAMVFSDLAVVDDALNPLYDSLMYVQCQDPNVRDYRQLLFKNVVNGNTMAINRALAQLSRECTDVPKVMMHDWWIAITAARFGKVLYLPEQTVLYRQHGENSVGANDEHTFSFYLNKIIRMDKLLDNFDGKARQAGIFLETFGDRLSEEEQEILAAYSARKMPLKMKWEYLQWLNSFSRKLGFLLLW